MVSVQGIARPRRHTKLRVLSICLERPKLQEGLAFCLDATVVDIAKMDRESRLLLSDDAGDVVGSRVVATPVREQSYRCPRRKFDHLRRSGRVRCTLEAEVLPFLQNRANQWFILSVNVLMYLFEEIPESKDSMLDQCDDPDRVSIAVAL